MIQKHSKATADMHQATAGQKKQRDSAGTLQGPGLSLKDRTVNEYGNYGSRA